MTPREFLETVFGGYAGVGFVSLWRLRDKISAHVPVADLDRAAALALEWDAKGHDVYVGCALRRPGLDKRQRGSAADCIAVPGFWADLDIARPDAPAPAAGEHRRARDREEALDILQKAVPLAPTLVVSSGWGLHTWWLFEEGPLRLDDTTRRRWVNAHRRWNHSLVAVAERRGIKIDDCSDITRVLRIPGTRNHKVKDQPRPVQIA